MSKTAIILINLGTPSTPTLSAIRAFLRCFLSDQRVVPLPKVFWQILLNLLILPFRSKKLVTQYRKIWLKDGSPLEVYTRKLSQNLRSTLVEATDDRPLMDYHYAMTYSAPFLSDVIQNCLTEKVENIIVLPLYPQYASSTTGAVFDQVLSTLKGRRYIPSVSLINNYHQHPAYIHALAESVNAYWKQHGKPQRLIMSFHGIPQKSVKEGDPYASQCETTAKLLAEALSLDSSEWQLVYQSRFGKARWLEPYCDKTLEILPQQGITHVHVICPGFSVDCLETLEEIAHTNKELFLNAGGKSYDYIPALNNSKLQVELLMKIILDR